MSVFTFINFEFLIISFELRHKIPPNGNFDAASGWCVVHKRLFISSTSPRQQTAEAKGNAQKNVKKYIMSRVVEFWSVVQVPVLSKLDI